MIHRKFLNVRNLTNHTKQKKKKNLTNHLSTLRRLTLCLFAPKLKGTNKRRTKTLIFVSFLHLVVVAEDRKSKFLCERNCSL